MGKFKEIDIQYIDYSITRWQFFWMKVKWRFWYRKIKRRIGHPVLDVEWPHSPMVEQDAKFLDFVALPNNYKEMLSLNGINVSGVFGVPKEIVDKRDRSIS